MKQTSHLVNLQHHSLGRTQVHWIGNNVFVCQENNSEQLYQVRTVNAGESLKEAVEQSDNDMLKTILSICIAPGNAHAIDVRYHKTCWTKYVLHGQREASTSDKKQSAKNHCWCVQV